MTQKSQEKLIQDLRERLLAGRYRPEEKLTEIRLARDLGVSRTLIRLALAGLEHEGLVVREPNRGFRVRAFTLGEVSDAIAVRGELESMAARLAAENGLTPEYRQRFQQQLDAMDQLLADGLDALEQRARWIDLNGQFHALLIASSGNATLENTIAELGKIPLVSSKAIVFDSRDPHHSLAQIRIAHQDHHAVFDAIVSRQGSRAEAIMREHTERSRANKRVSFGSIQLQQTQPPLPGLRLVSERD